MRFYNLELFVYSIAFVVEAFLVGNTKMTMTSISFTTNYENVTFVPMVFENTTLNENITLDPFDYEYDFNSSMGYLPLAELVPVTLVFGITLLFGLIGNILVIVSVARFKKMQTVTNVFLLSLATADLLLVVVCIPVKVSHFDLVHVYLIHELIFTAITTLRYALF